MKVKRILGWLLLATGLLCLATPLWIEWHHHQDVTALEEALSLVADAQDGETSKEVVAQNGFTVQELEQVMELEIPSISLKQFVLSETTEENLNIALTQIKEHQQPGAGNFTIAGHRGYRDGRHFSKLDQVEAGEEIRLHAGGKTYVYVISGAAVIAETDVHVLNDTPDRTEITLITCTPSGKQRIAVTGELQEVIDS
ncbi:class D sortase [Planomicrobium sp. YIM 101495]|uniref:class D sortase n=1 Tax=Planomicrobium sp. YIM 101495 TaxID=2665160 RepID=UPI001E5F3A89|nr:class D sortase [Planomicrobium sp. YIM 101495]